MAYEELQLEFRSKVVGLIKGCKHEKFYKYGKAKIETFADKKRAREVGLGDVSLDARNVYRTLDKDIAEIKGQEGKEPNYLILIHDILKKRRAFLQAECGGDIEEELIDASDEVIKLSKIYEELYRKFVDIAAGKRLLDKLNIKRKALSAEVVKEIRRYTKEQIFVMQHELGA